MFSNQEDIVAIFLPQCAVVNIVSICYKLFSFKVSYTVILKTKTVILETRNPGNQKYFSFLIIINIMKIFK